ncbi:ABC transporter ATP-binding protein [Halobellus ruber]|uniref:Molybdate/tungstate import ATP-binding protein WtpC n=1 Tax=Halobellus ruber TaxID=2761102 RepID=A0A7J9SK42_9EURY|nr:ABC transporter ATP-binding protein [Halobellus ruber]MBB6647285.1 ABC transporter ATP-binding protein [Halobellus ruber]
MILRTEGLTKRFGGTTAVDDVSVSIASGEFFALVGPSGCGKTTTLRMLAGLETPTAGRVEIAGRDVTDWPPRERDTNLVFQDLVLFTHMTVAENVAYGLARDGVPAAERRRRAAEMLSTVGLEGFGDRDPTELSGGQRQRVALARALINEPSVLLLDEPLSSLDRKLRAEMRAELRRIQNDVGTTFLYVTHDQESAMSMSDRLAVMRAGRIVESGAPESLYGHPRTAFVADFLGNANLLSGHVRERRSEGAVVDAAGGRFAAAVGDDRPAPGAEVTAMVRPEDLRFGGDTFAGTVRDIGYKGSHAAYAVALDAGPTVQVRSGTDDRIEVGDGVELGVTDAAVVNGGTGGDETAESGVGAENDGDDGTTLVDGATGSDE